MKKALFVLIVIIAGFTTMSRAQFVLNGEFRPRFEHNHGYKTLATDNQKPSDFITQRTRLNFNYKTDRLKTYLSLQDVRTWGSQKISVTNEDFAVSLHEAWCEIGLTENLLLKLGRQEISYDNQRILSNPNWSQQGITHDLALLKYEKNFSLHFGLAYNQNTDIKNNLYEGPTYKALQFLWLSKTLNKLTFSFLFVNDGYELIKPISGAEIKYRQTFGPSFSYKSDKFSLQSSAFYQTGKSVTEKTINAYNYYLKTTLQLNEMVALGAGLDFLSGANQTITPQKTIKVFTPSYGSNHTFLGFMDYFLPNSYGDIGLVNGFLHATIKKGKFSFLPVIHFFSATTDVLNPITPTQTMPSNLGTELDLIFSYKHSDMVSFQAGYSQMFAAKTMQAIKGGSKDELNNWAYFMVTVTPVFIK